MVKTLLPVLPLPAKALLLGVVVSASALAGGPAKAVGTYIDPASTPSTTQGTFNSSANPYITLTGVTYGEGSGGNTNFMEYNNITDVGSYSGISMAVWQDAKPGATSINFWANSGNNPVVNLRLDSNDYLGIISRQIKQQGNTLAFQWAAIDSSSWYSNSTVVAASNPSTYLLWVTSPFAGPWSTSSDPVVGDLNTVLAAQSTPTATTEGVPAPLPFLLGPVMAGFLPKLRRFRLEQRQATIA